LPPHPNVTPPALAERGRHPPQIVRWLIAGTAAAAGHHADDIFETLRIVAAISMTLAGQPGCRVDVARNIGDWPPPLLRTTRPTLLCMLPAANGSPRSSRYAGRLPLLRICICGGDKVSNELERRSRLAGFTIDEVYGMTETGASRSIHRAIIASARSAN
jgi:hypothetical protein